jgi:hypothetical protein
MFSVFDARCSRLGECLFPFTMLTYFATIAAAAFNIFVNVDYVCKVSLSFSVILEQSEKFRFSN